MIYSIDIALVGHTSTHAPQSRHSLASTTAMFSPFSEIASAGHSSRHVPQPTHSLTLITATIFITLRAFVKVITIYIATSNIR